jgi:hypothetical protein
VKAGLVAALVAALAVAAAPLGVRAQTAPTGTAPTGTAPTGTAPAGAAPPASRPRLGALMTMTVQPRHTKLALAGQARNWPYAAYELHELQESFERAARAWPQWRTVPIAEMMGNLTTEPMAALAQAIKSADVTRFTAAYGQLTAACNACHQAADRGVVVIQVPQGTAFPDQDFRPAKP